MAYFRKATKKLSDETLLHRYTHKGDTDAFGVLYDRYFVSVCKYLCWLGLDAALAKDLAQNIFLKIHESPGLFDTKKNFKTWLFVIVRNQWKNALRDQQTRIKHHKNAMLFSVEEHQEVTSISAKVSVQKAIARLSEKHREVIALKYSSNFSIQEISTMLDCSPGTVKSRLFYAIKAIKEQV